MFKKVQNIIATGLASLVFIFIPIQAKAAHSNTLTWTQSVDTVTGNCIFRSATKGGENAANPLFCSSTPITAYTDSTVSAGDSWYYTTNAVNGTKQSGFSNEVGPLVTPFLPPTNLSGSSQ